MSPDSALTLRPVFLTATIALAFTAPILAERAVEPSESPPVVVVRGESGLSWAFVYEVASQRLACYESNPLGLELKGLRRITWDLQLEHLSGAAALREPSVAEVRAHVRKNADTTPEETLPGKNPAALSAVLGAQSEPWVFVYDADSERLAGYQGGKIGLQLRGVRHVSWDLQLEDLGGRRQGRLPSVALVRREVEKNTERAARQGAPKRIHDPLLATIQDVRGAPRAFLYDPERERLAAYRIQNIGIELLGVRRVTWDRQLKSTVCFDSTGPTVNEVRKLIEANGSPADKSVAAAAKLTFAVSRGPSREPQVTILDPDSRLLLEYRSRFRGIEFRAARFMRKDLESEKENDTGEP